MSVSFCRGPPPRAAQTKKKSWLLFWWAKLDRGGGSSQQKKSWSGPLKRKRHHNVSLAPQPLAPCRGRKEKPWGLAPGTYKPRRSPPRETHHGASSSKPRKRDFGAPSDSHAAHGVHAKTMPRSEDTKFINNVPKSPNSQPLNMRSIHMGGFLLITLETGSKQSPHFETSTYRSYLCLAPRIVPANHGKSPSFPCSALVIFQSSGKTYQEANNLSEICAVPRFQRGAV